MLHIRTIEENINRQWPRVQEQTLDRGIRETENRTEFTPIYSPQCNSRIEGFHKFLKATIAKQLETRVEWDNLVWKATATYNFFPTESSGVAPFFLMFGREAAVKHTLLESENPKYLGTDDGMISVGLMTKLYPVVAHNLNEARKARDGNKKGTTPKELDVLKIGDNVLVRDHTSKAFQPKYKDFCIVGLLGKNQIEIKDNHGHTTKVHCKDVKKIPMTEKVCQLYEEEQLGKTREGRKAIPANKMPDLGGDIAETLAVEENSKENNTTLGLQTVIMISIIITAITRMITTQLGKLSRILKGAMQTIIEISRNTGIQNIRDSYKTARLAISIATNTTSRNNRIKKSPENDRNNHNNTDLQKLIDQQDYSYQPHSPSRSGNYNN